MRGPGPPVGQDPSSPSQALTLWLILARIEKIDRLIDDAVYLIHAKTRRREGTMSPER